MFFSNEKYIIESWKSKNDTESFLQYQVERFLAWFFRGLFFAWKYNQFQMLLIFRELTQTQRHIAVSIRSPTRWLHVNLLTECCQLEIEAIELPGNFSSIVKCYL